MPRLLHSWNQENLFRTVLAFSNSKIEDINKKWLEKQLQLYYNPPSDSDDIPQKLVSFIDYYIQLKGTDVTPSTIQKFRVVKRKLERLEKKRDTPIMICQINERFQQEFIKYSQDEKYGLNTTERDIRFIKTFCRKARYLGVKTHSQLDGLGIKAKKIEIVYLNEDEIEKIKNTQLNESLDNVRDWLIISCYTGQRISEFMKVDIEKIKENKKAPLLEFKQKKTPKPMTIPLHPEVIAILNKRNYNFPKPISEVKYNLYVKDVCRKAGINKKTYGSIMKKVSLSDGRKVNRKQDAEYEKWELISSHIGRRSFATNFYGKIPTPLLKNITGHSTESVFLNYIGKSTEDFALMTADYFYNE